MKRRSDLLQALGREREAISLIGGGWRGEAQEAAWRVARRVLADEYPAANLLKNLRAEVDLEVLHPTFDDPNNVEAAIADLGPFLNEGTAEQIRRVHQEWLGLSEPGRELEGEGWT